MAAATQQLDTVFRAMADPTRIVVLERLSRGPASVSELSQGVSMALPSFMQHLRVLEDCKLVRSEKHGRVRTYELEAEPLMQAELWLNRQRSIWESRLDRMTVYAESLAARKNDIED
ncbi:MAG: metalloregulator ArsR/SmtB family transcription factor [bacterium]|nr:metalloregulator ArsR/SmtB family transcription factor [bacterium]